MALPALSMPSEFPTLFQRPDRVHEPLYVLCTVYNPARYRSRWRLYEDFSLHVQQSGGILYTCEITLGGRDFVVTESHNPCHLQLRTTDEMWFKENAINLLAARLPPEAQKIAYVDADFHFARPDWADETRQMLEHYPLVQMWSSLHNLTATYTVSSPLRSFVSLWQEFGEISVPQAVKLPYAYDRWGAPGGAWAMWREVWDALGGLIDYCILGAGDYWMALALTGQAEPIIARAKHAGHGITPALVPRILEWQRRAEESRWRGRPLVRNVGVVPGTVLHAWHGSHADRHYDTRGEILRRHDFDPALDLKRGVNGLYQFTNRRPGLRREVQQYLHSRNEDAV